MMKEIKPKNRDTYKIAGLLSLFLSDHKEFSSDDFFDFARQHGIRAKVITKIIGNLFKGYQFAKVIEKTGSFRLSERIGVPVPIWKTNN